MRLVRSPFLYWIVKSCTILFVNWHYPGSIGIRGLCGGPWEPPVLRKILVTAVGKVQRLRNVVGWFCSAGMCGREPRCCDSLATCKQISFCFLSTSVLKAHLFHHIRRNVHIFYCHIIFFLFKTKITICLYRLEESPTWKQQFNDR